MDRIKPEFMKKLTKFIVISIWVSSLLITHDFYLCKLTIQLVTHAVDKTYVFFICNGLLVFVTKYSGLIASSKPLEESWSNADNTFDHRYFDGYDAMMKLEYYYSVHERGTNTFLAEEVSTQEDQETEEENEAAEEEESDEALANNGDVEEECDIHGETREEEDNVGVVTEEDINKKFDEFIKKMKEELRIEARRQVILV